METDGTRIGVLTILAKYSLAQCLNVKCRNTCICTSKLQSSIINYIYTNSNNLHYIYYVLKCVHDYMYLHHI